MYKRHLLQIAVLVFTIILMGFSAWAVPQTINYQGKLTDPNGTAVTGSHILEFYLYTEKQGGSDLWNEQQTVQLTEGIYNVLLGSVEPFPNNLFDNELLYLEVKIFRSTTGWETLSPRQPLTSTPFAIKAGDAITAGNADTVDGLQGNDLEESAEIDNKINTHTAISNAHHTKTTSFTELIDTATDDQIPDDITVNYAMDADKLDGKHASEFGDGHSLDAADGDPVDAVYMDANGNLGIGTTSPQGKLDVNGNVKATSFVGDGSGLTGVVKTESDPVFTSWDKSSGISITESQISDLGHFTNSDETDPVFGASAASGITSSDINNWDNAYSWGDHSTAGYDTTNDSWTGTGDVYTTSGNVGIGTSNPASKLAGAYGLTIYHSNQPALAFSNSSGTRNWILIKPYNEFRLYNQLDGDVVTVKPGGNVGIGTRSPAGKLDVNGTIYQRGVQLHADYVFEPDYKLESIEEHSEFMWINKHLKAIPKAKVDEDGKEIVEVGAHRKGIVEELEKAHIYIEQLHKQISELSIRIEALESNN